MSLSGRRAALALGAYVVAVTVFWTGREPSVGPFTPASGDEVVERVPPRGSEHTLDELETMRARLRATPRELALAVEVAQHQIQLARRDADPRRLGYAQAALTPWWDEELPPVRVRLLRATIRQSRHEFELAMKDLDTVVRDEPQNAQAWLTRAMVLMVQGRLAQAKESCERLAPSIDPLVRRLCSASVEGLTQNAAAAYRDLGEVHAATPFAPPELGAWAASTLGEIAARLGKADEAERYFRDALALWPQDNSARGALADLLIDLDRPKEVVPLLIEETQNDSLLLRLAIAEAAVGAPEASKHREELRARFDASRARGDTVHRREEARFLLAFHGEARAALQLAQENWEVQREPWDARILLEAALAANVPEAALPVLRALEAQGLQDPLLRQRMLAVGGVGQ